MPRKTWLPWTELVTKEGIPGAKQIWDEKKMDTTLNEYRHDEGHELDSMELSLYPDLIGLSSENNPLRAHSSRCRGMPEPCNDPWEYHAYRNVRKSDMRQTGTVEESNKT